MLITKLLVITSWKKIKWHFFENLKYLTIRIIMGAITIVCDALLSPKLDPRWALVSKTTELWGLKGMFLALSTKRGRGACWSSEIGIGRGTSFSYLLEPAPNQSTSWLIHLLEHL
jgi:hypothetical protein